MPNRKQASMIEKAYTVAENDWTRMRIQTISSASAPAPDKAIAQRIAELPRDGAATPVDDGVSATGVDGVDGMIFMPISAAVPPISRLIRTATSIVLAVP